MNNQLHTVLLAISILLPFSASAQVPEAGSARSVYLKLAEDFYEEILTMDAVTESQQEREKAIAEMRAALKTPAANLFQFENGKSWAWAWPVQKQFAPVASSGGFEKVQVQQLPQAQDTHSIQDLNTYIKARLGSQSSELIRNGLIEAKVLGGFEKSLPAFLKVSPESIHKLPSLYESWGIRRYLVSTGGLKPTLVYVVPPALQYLEHYQLMISQLTGKKAEVYRSAADFETWKNSLADGVRQIGTEHGRKFDYVALGYYNQWPEVLRLQYEILTQKETSLSSGHLGRSFRIQNKKTGQILNLLTLGHTKTIWGEASAYLMEGALAFHPRAVVFLGSAGSLSEKTQVYDISAPQAFHLKGSSVPVENFIRSARSQVIQGVAVRRDVTHGNTASPAAQTLKYLQKHSQAGVDTLDVEQNLIAEHVNRYNRAHQTDIKFGAINLITDKPLGHAEHNLDRIDHNKKARARLAAVELAIEAFQIEKSSPLRCSKVHLK